MHRGRCSFVRPSDRPRRSGCLSESHHPRALRPRCTRDTRVSTETSQAPARRKKSALCGFFFTRRTYLRQSLFALSQRDQGFAEPGALSSTSPADLPLPRTASRESFVLLASRARRSGNLRCPWIPCKGIRRRKGRKLRTSGGRMTGKHAVVTGAGTGIGRAIALRLAGDGAAVTLLGLEPEGLAETAAQIEGATHVEPCDIRERELVDAALARAADALG